MNQFDSRYYCTPHFDTSLIDLDPDSRSQECEKPLTSAPIILQGFQLIWIRFGVQLRLDGLMNLILILFRYSVFKGDVPAYMILLEKKL